MALPKKRKKDLTVKRRGLQDGPKEYKDQFLEKNRSFLPRGVDHADLDSGFVDFVEKDLGIVVGDNKVPVLFLTLSRWREFVKTWQNSDKYKNIKIPFVSIVRKPDAQPGTNPADFKIPVRATFDYARIPVWNGNKKGMDIHKIPQPVGVDLTYTVRFFTYKMKELNKLNQKVLQTFASAQAYVNIKGHYFPIMLESIGDESVVDNLDGKRYYVQTYEMRLMGYLVDEDEFEVVPALERVLTLTEITTKKPKPKIKITNNRFKKGDDFEGFDCVIEFGPNSPGTIEFIAGDADIYIGNVYQISTIKRENVQDIEVKVNGNVVTVPFEVIHTDLVTINVDIIDGSKSAIITLNGVIKK